MDRIGRVIEREIERVRIERLREVERARLRERERARTRPTIWQVIKNFFNSSPFNTRLELREELRINGFNENNITSMDTYRNYLDKAGYLRTVRRGAYETIKEIPIDLSIQSCRNEAYGNRNPFPILMGMDENIIFGKPLKLKINRRRRKVKKEKEFFTKGDFEI
jgi:hypothetical protein